MTQIGDMIEILCSHHRWQPKPRERVLLKMNGEWEIVVAVWPSEWRASLSCDGFICEDIRYISADVPMTKMGWGAMCDAEGYRTGPNPFWPNYHGPILLSGVEEDFDMYKVELSQRDLDDLGPLLSKSKETDL